ncbi:MAG: DoxX family protein [Undibacterium sp.]|nr:DoxX family protein [Undibacterium sp.]
MKQRMKQLCQNFPYLRVEHSYMIFRVTLAVLFMAHAIRRFFEANYFYEFANFLDQRHVPFGFAVVCTATLIEIVGGSLLIFNQFVKWVALGFFCISVGGIIIIHAQLGWFVGEWGTGGVEYSVALCAMCLLLAVLDRDQLGKNELKRVSA